MIIRCNSCEKEFVVPDNAIPAAGRLVQCSSCGNKWTQYPLKKEEKKTIKEKTSKIEPFKKGIIQKSKKIKKKKVVKREGPTLYSQEYLEKKHGIKLNQNQENKKTIKESSKKESLGFGFYSYSLLLLITLTTLIGILNLTQSIIIHNFPFTETYIDNLFETISNFRTLITDILSRY
tara:strand:- start:263 stop:793 length:531 start_codon:yes stop_codon:yes gene_type:complete